jgi:hypothetical protein
VNRTGSGYYGPRYGYGYGPGMAVLDTTLAVGAGAAIGSSMARGNSTTYVQQPATNNNPQVYIVPTNLGGQPYPPQTGYPQPGYPQPYYPQQPVYYPQQ